METNPQEEKAKRGFTRKEIPDSPLEAKAIGSDGDPGWIEGYMSTFNNVDSVGDIVVPGAFKKTIKERVNGKKISILVKHMRDGGDFMEEVALVTEAKEDDKGLWFHADFLSDSFSQSVRERILERKSKGFKTPLSIGYIPIQIEPGTKNGQSVWYLRELKLMEATLTIRPANEKALLTSAKATEETPNGDPESRADSPPGEGPADPVDTWEADLMEMEAKAIDSFILTEGE